EKERVMSGIYYSTALKGKSALGAALANHQAEDAPQAVATVLSSIERELVFECEFLMQVEACLTSVHDRVFGPELATPSGNDNSVPQPMGHTASIARTVDRINGLRDRIHALLSSVERIA
ncbi:MAG TPA: hypothetical protein VF491_20435, partial [Vicinamibacterales bacterium]